MGVSEIAFYTAGLQFAQAGVAYLGKINPPPTNVWALAAMAVGKQLAANAVSAFTAALAAANAEFKTSQSAELGAVNKLNTLPSIN
jgi:hypothetical protein